MTSSLSTTNTLLGIMAVASLVEMIGLALVCAGLFLVSRRLIQLINTVEEKQIAPTGSRVQAILDDIKDVTSMIRGIVTMMRRFGGAA